MDRRSFIRNSAATLGTAAVGAAGFSGKAEASTRAANTSTIRAFPKSRPITDGVPGDSGIDTVVVVMMENRSFDSYLGWLRNDGDYINAGLSRYGFKFGVDSEQDQRFLDPDGVFHSTAHFKINAAGSDPFRGCGHPDPGHGWNAGRAQRDQGFVAASSGNDDFALSFYRGNDLPFYRELAHRFTVADQWHASILGPTYPNREYLLAGQSGGNKTNYLPITEGGFQWMTIVDKLAYAGVSVIDYASDLPPLLLWGNRMSPHVRTIDDYYTDCAAGTLPSVCFVDPSFGGDNRSDDHPHGDIRAGQKFVQDTFTAFAKSSHWNRGAFIVLYDEWGGFYDHVNPPHLPDDRRSADDANDFSQAGFRVPCMIASPRVRPGWVDHHQYDHTSILRFLEWRFLGAPATGPGLDSDTWFLTLRDRFARNLGRTFTLDYSNREVGFDLNMAMADPGGACAPKPAALSFDQTPVRESNPEHSFATPEAREYFASVGCKA